LGVDLNHQSLNPYVPAQLIDEDRGMGGRGRDVASWKWVENRLSELGFQASQNKKILGYTKDTANAVVYADPRKDGLISFMVVLKPVKMDLNRWERRKIPAGSFSISDRWKNDLLHKLDMAIAVAIKDLLPKPRLVP
jgi:hypothetical protein